MLQKHDRFFITRPANENWWWARKESDPQGLEKKVLKEVVRLEETDADLALQLQLQWQEEVSTCCASSPQCAYITYSSSLTRREFCRMRELLQNMVKPDHLAKG